MTSRPAVAVFDRELHYVAPTLPGSTRFGLAGAALAGQCHDELDLDGGLQFAQLQRRALSGEAVNGCETSERDAAGQLHRRCISIRPRLAATAPSSGSSPRCTRS